MNPPIQELTRAVEQEARKRPEVQRLVTHPGVGPLTALAFVLIIGTPERFGCSKQIDSYVGLIPSEHSSAGHKNRSLRPGLPLDSWSRTTPSEENRKKAGARYSYAIG
jgi:transposase